MAKETKKTKIKDARPKKAGAAASSRREDEPKPKRAPEPEPEASEEEETASGVAEAAEDGDEGERLEAEADGALAARTDAELTEEEGDIPVAQLGLARYVTAAFLGAALLGAYVFGKTIHGAWELAANKAWFARQFPQLAAVPDDTKGILGTVVGGLVAFLLVFRLYRKPDVRTWADEVANEMREVKWPTRSDVQGSTIVVIAASAVAALYLLVLDRLWGFITNIVYGGGS